jgi:hypothetical protein
MVRNRPHLQAWLQHQTVFVPHTRLNPFPLFTSFDVAKGDNISHPFSPFVSLGAEQKILILSNTNKATVWSDYLSGQSTSWSV